MATQKKVDQYAQIERMINGASAIHVDGYGLTTWNIGSLGFEGEYTNNDAVTELTFSAEDLKNAIIKGHKITVLTFNNVFVIECFRITPFEG